MQLQEYRYTFSSFDLVYLTDQETGQMSMVLLPKGAETKYRARKLLMDAPELTRVGLQCPAWYVGSLCHLALRHHPQSNGTAGTLLDGYSTKQLRFQAQTVDKQKHCTSIHTLLRAPEGYEILHTASHFEGEDGIEVEVTFRNQTGAPVQLDMLSSFALDNLSPLAEDDSTNSILLHRFYGGWSREGRRRTDTLEALNLERTWFSCRPESERFGSLGSFPVDRYFPVSVVEDCKNHVCWGAQLACNSSWQMELCRVNDCLLLAGGLADREFGAWSKIIPDGSSFSAPKAFLSVGSDVQSVCNQLTNLHQKYVDQQPASEQTLPITFNEWCTSWGHPSEQEILAIAEKLRDSPVQYIAIDAGWTKTVNDHLGQGGNGDWILNEAAFPHGLLWLSRKLQSMGKKLGIWFEFEVTTAGARVHEADYDDWHLQRNGQVLTTGDDRSFWDFRQPRVVSYLKEKVLRFLQEHEINYLKVDYNGSIGIGCDGADRVGCEGAESLGEGLRQQMEAVHDFFDLLRQKLPDLVIENCASGGHRLEPSMMDRTAMSSTTDAHECPEIPIIAANTDLLILPRQSLIWCVLVKGQSIQQLRYRLAAGFLGRMALSGDILELRDEQWNLVQEAMAFYEQAKVILKHCKLQVYQNFLDESIRYARGLQAVCFRGVNNKTLLVCHSLNQAEPAELTLPIKLDHPVLHTFGPQNYLSASSDGQLRISGMPSYEAFALIF